MGELVNLADARTKRDEERAKQAAEREAAGLPPPEDEPASLRELRRRMRDYDKRLKKRADERKKHNDANKPPRKPGGR